MLTAILFGGSLSVQLLVHLKMVFIRNGSVCMAMKLFVYLDKVHIIFSFVSKQIFESERLNRSLMLDTRLQICCKESYRLLHI